MMKLARILRDWAIPDILDAVKAAGKIHRADELVCNGCAYQTDDGQWVDLGNSPCRSPYGRAMATLDKIVARYPGFSWHHQGDPRGASVYILPPGSVRDGETVEQAYMRGVPL